MDQKPWLIHYQDGVPPTLRPYPQRTLLDVVADTAKQRPDHTAVIFKGARLSYRKLERLSDALAAALADFGVKKGDRVALLLPNCPQLLIGQLGIWKAGGIASPMNPLYSEPELEELFRESGAEVALVLTPFYTRARTIQSRTSLRLLIATNIKEYLPTPMRFLFTLAKEKKEGHRITLQPGDVWLGDALRKYQGRPRPNIAVKPDDPAILLFTGGTTGTPKAAVGVHQGLLMSGMQFQAWFLGIMQPWKDRIFLSLPLFHVYAQAAVLPTALVGHHPLVLAPNPRDLNDTLDAIHKARPAFVPGVPTLFNALLNHPSVKAHKVDLTSVKLCISAAAPLMLETKQQFERLTGGHIIEGYALTESMCAAVATPPRGTYKLGSVGLPLPDVEVRIVDATTGERELEAGEMGEIVMRAPQVMRGYWNDPAETAQAIRNGWLFTGDLGYLDTDSYLFIVDRKKDLIKCGGFQVWPREVEEVLATHPAVAEVGVAGVSDVYSGEVVKAWVVLREGMSATGDELRDYCRARLSHYKAPKYVEFREALPKSMIGKILRRELVASEDVPAPSSAPESLEVAPVEAPA
ncbi:MAG: long-chain fatty acid--CoA ligase [Anaerolineae bacterium]